MYYLAIFLGGGLGSLCRFMLSKWNKSEALFLPLGTIAANLFACVVLGFVVALIGSKPNLHPSFKAFFAIGFCGGFSTFSTFSLETFTLLQNGQALYALANVGISLVVCLLAIYLGFLLHNSLLQ